MLVPAFNLKLGQQVQSGLVVIGKFNGQTPSLACATTGGKVLLHSPHEGSDANNGQLPAIRYLNFNRKMTALAAGMISEGTEHGNRDTLFVGTQSNLMAYDVERNSELFFKDLPDGVNSLIVGKFSNMSPPVVVVGGNCSIFGFDREGNETFWTVTGDNVSALALCDASGGKSAGTKELLVGSDDFELRFFQDQEIVREITETDKISFLQPLNTTQFAYGLGNGTVGVYNASRQRMWRVKAKNNVTALQSYDLDLDGVSEVVSGWSNGSFNVRRDSTGDIIFKETMKAPVAAILRSDYRMDGKEALMICSESGEIVAYMATDIDLTLAADTSGISGAVGTGEQKALAELHAKKQQLTTELRSLEKSLKGSKSGDTTLGALPANTNLSYSLNTDAVAGVISIRVEASTDVQLHTILAFDTEGILLSGGEVIVSTPASGSRSGALSIKPSKHAACVLKLQTHVSLRGHSELLHVFESDVSLPIFAAFQNMPDRASCPQPTSEVSFQLPATTCARIEAWIRSCFLVDKSLSFVNSNGNISAYFVSLVSSNTVVGGSPLFVITSANGNRTDVKLLLSSMELAGDLVQSIATFCNIAELDPICKFPQELDTLRELITNVAEFNSSRAKLQADMADDSQRVKALIVRAEDSRLMVDMDYMRRAYTELYSLNNQLIGGYNTRATNHEALLVALKQVNLIIQRASNLRVGSAKSRVVTACRAAVKANNMETLVGIISGESK